MLKATLCLVLLGTSLVACTNRQVKKNTQQKTKTFYSIENQTVQFHVNNEKVKCDKPCEIKKYNNFIVLKSENKNTVYNRFGQLVYSGPQEMIEVTQNYLKMVKGQIETVISGYTGKVVLKVNRGSDILKISDHFLIVQSNLRVKIWNKHAQVIYKYKAQKHIKTYISNGFAGLQADHRQLVMFNSGQQKLVSYTLPQPKNIDVSLNDNFMHFRVGKDISSLYHVSGQRLMNFTGRPTEKVYITETTAGFYDISSSASFWNQKGEHLKSFIKKSGLEVTQHNNKIMYKFNTDKEFKAIN